MYTICPDFYCNKYERPAMLAAGQYVFNVFCSCLCDLSFFSLFFRRLQSTRSRNRSHHVLEELLPPASDSQHNLRKRHHNISLPEKKGHLAAKNFIIRLLYKDIYWLQYWLSHNLTFSRFLFYHTVLRCVLSAEGFHNKDWLTKVWSCSRVTQTYKTKIQSEISGPSS